MHKLFLFFISSGALIIYLGLIITGFFSSIFGSSFISSFVSFFGSSLFFVSFLPFPFLESFLPVFFPPLFFKSCLPVIGLLFASVVILPFPVLIFVPPAFIVNFFLSLILCISVVS